MSLVQLFQDKVPEVFSFLHDEFGFDFKTISDHIVIGQKGDILVRFVLDRGILFSVAIEVKGRLGKTAIGDARYRKLGATAIARCLDSTYTPYIVNIRSEEDLTNQMRERAMVLEKYCKKILKGDVSDWKRIVYCLLTR